MNTYRIVIKRHTNADWEVLKEGLDEGSAKDWLETAVKDFPQSKYSAASLTASCAGLTGETIKYKAEPEQ